MHGNMNWLYPAQFGIGGPIIMLIIELALLALLIYLVVKVASKDRGIFRKDRVTALNILKNRFAKGEITVEEYQAAKNILKD